VLQQVAVLVAAFVTGITGFGFNAVSLPLLAVAFEPHRAVVVGLLDALLIFGLALLVPSVRKDMDTRMVLILFASSLPGLPLGAALLVWLDERLLRIVIGVLTFGYAAGQLTGLMPTLHAKRRQAPFVGVLSGILSSSVSLGGTPVMLYLIGFGSAPRDLRATAAAYVFLTTLASLAVLYWTGLLDGGTVQDAATLAPASVVGLAAGTFAFRYVSRTLFVRLTLVLLAMGGLVALAAALR
jgi:uncharacterized membrane protein YfcA